MMVRSTAGSGETGGHAQSASRVSSPCPHPPSWANSGLLRNGRSTLQRRGRRTTTIPGPLGARPACARSLRLMSACGASCRRCPAATPQRTGGSQTHVQKFRRVHACPGVWATPYDAWRSWPWVAPHGVRARPHGCRPRHDHLACITGLLCGQSAPLRGHRVAHGGVAHAPPCTAHASPHVQRATAGSTLEGGCTLRRGCFDHLRGWLRSDLYNTEPG